MFRALPKTKCPQIQSGRSLDATDCSFVPDTTTHQPPHFRAFRPQQHRLRPASIRATDSPHILPTHSYTRRNGRWKGYLHPAETRPSGASDSCAGKTGGKTGGKAGGDNSGKSQKSHSAKAGLQFPIGRISRFLKKGGLQVCISCLLLDRRGSKLGSGGRVAKHFSRHSHTAPPAKHAMRPRPSDLQHTGHMTRHCDHC